MKEKLIPFYEMQKAMKVQPQSSLPRAIRKQIGLFLDRYNPQGLLELFSFIRERETYLNIDEYIEAQAALEAAIKKYGPEIPESDYISAHKSLNKFIMQNPQYLNSAIEARQKQAVFEILKMNRINFNIKDIDGTTPLMKAAQTGDLELLEALLQLPGIEVNAKDTTQWTALMLAAHKGHTHIVERLLAVKGIDIDLKNYHKQTALDIATDRGHSEIVEAFTTKANSLKK